MARNYRERTAVLTQSDGARWTFTTRESAPAPSMYVLEDVTGWYGGSGVRRTVTPRYGHGSFMGPGYRDGRAMTLKGGIICATADERDWQERNLSGALWDGLDGSLWYDDGETQLTAPVALDGAPQVVKSGTKALVVQVPLLSETPFLFGEWHELTLTPPGAGVGFEIPPLQEGVISFGTEIRTRSLVWNDGNADSFPLFTVWAESPAGFSVGIGGRRVTYPWPTFADVPITVDMEGALLASGQDQTHMVGERDWASIPAASIETPTFDFLAGGRGFCNVSFRDTYI